MSGQIKILAPTGMLGYSFSESLCLEAIEEGVDAMIMDSGSTDSGPSKLALGTTTVSREAYERDLSVLVKFCHFHHVPILIGSAGGDGSDQHVDLFVDIITTIIKNSKYRSMKILTIKAEVAKTTVKTAFDEKRIKPCGTAVPSLKAEDIDDASCIVGQFGHEPWLAAMQDHPDFDIIIGGRTYDPAPYAAFCVFKGLTDLGLAYHMGKIMECGGLCAVPKSSEAIATIRQDSFDLRPLDKEAKCTKMSVAAHTLYEKSRPDLLIGPGGTLDVRGAVYESLEDGKSVRVKGAVFHAVNKEDYTIKLEGARVSGYLAVFIGGINDPILGGQIDVFLENVQAKLREVISFDFDINIHVYGKDHALPGISAEVTTPREVGIVGQVRAASQSKAKDVASMARIFCSHGPYAGQVATAGNFAMPFSPLEISMGPVPEFCLYHLMTVDDSVGMFPVAVVNIKGFDGDATPANTVLSEAAKATNRTKKGGGFSLSSLSRTAHSSTTATNIILPGPAAPAGNVHLASLASVIRSKNAGPYEVTVDVMFSTADVFNKVKQTGVLTQESFAELYGIDHDDIIACMWWEPALAFKLTIKRANVSASFYDQDMHGSGKHVPLMYMAVPWET